MGVLNTVLSDGKGERKFWDSFARWPDQMAGRPYCGEILISADGHDLSITFHALDSRKPPAARLNVFDDSWAWLAAHPEFMGMLASWGENPSIDTVKMALRAAGFRDCTDEKDED